MKKFRLIVAALAITGATALTPSSADAFWFCPFGGPWGGNPGWANDLFGGYGYPGGWGGYPYGGYGYPGAWGGYPYGGYGYHGLWSGYPYGGYPYARPVVPQAPAHSKPAE